VVWVIAPMISRSIELNILKFAVAALAAALSRARARARTRAKGLPIKLALYDGYVGAYGEFYRNDYTYRLIDQAANLKAGRNARK